MFFVCLLKLSLTFDIGQRQFFKTNSNPETSGPKPKFQNLLNQILMSILKINLVLFGIGNVGSALINQVIEQQQTLLEEKNIELVFAIITNSTIAFFERENQKNRWDADFTKSPAPFTIENIIDYTKEAELENLIAIDATTSTEIHKSYEALLQNNFDILSINSNVQQAKLAPKDLLKGILEIANQYRTLKRQTA